MKSKMRSRKIFHSWRCGYAHGKGGIPEHVKQRQIAPKAVK